MFSCEYCKTFKNSYFEEHLRMSASVDSGLNTSLKLIPQFVIENMLRKLLYKIQNLTYFPGVEILWKRTRNSSETVLFKKFPHQEISWNYGIFTVLKCIAACYGLTTLHMFKGWKYSYVKSKDRSLGEKIIKNTK